MKKTMIACLLAAVSCREVPAHQSTEISTERQNWYRIARSHYGPHGRLQVGYVDPKTHEAYWFTTTVDSLRYYDSTIGYPSAGMSPVESLVTEK